MQGFGPTRQPNAKLYFGKSSGLQRWFAEKSPLGGPVKASNSSFGTEEAPEEENAFVGEDAAVFELSKQKLSSWVSFSVILGVVLAILNYIWIDPTTGYGNAFVQAMSTVSDNHEVRSKAMSGFYSVLAIHYMNCFVLASEVLGE